MGRPLTGSRFHANLAIAMTGAESASKFLLKNPLHFVTKKDTSRPLSLHVIEFSVMVPLRRKEWAQSGHRNLLPLSERLLMMMVSGTLILWQVAAFSSISTGP